MSCAILRQTLPSYAPKSETISCLSSKRIISFSLSALTTLWFHLESVCLPRSITLSGLPHWCEVRIIRRLSHVHLQEHPLIEHRVQFHSIEFILAVSGIIERRDVVQWWVLKAHHMSSTNDDSLELASCSDTIVNCNKNLVRKANERMWIFQWSFGQVLSCCLPLLSSYVRALLNTYDGVQCKWPTYSAVLQCERSDRESCCVNWMDIDPE